MDTPTPGTRYSCPHCATVVRLERTVVNGDRMDGCSIGDGSDNVVLRFAKCPNCEGIIIEGTAQRPETTWMIWPRHGGRPPLHPSVPKELADDHREAALILYDSPKASAALSRRCLQTLLVRQGATKRDLVDQIDELRPTLPSHVNNFIDNVRQLGNISAHAKQSKATAEIIDVEPHESEWMLELLEELFDHYYAKPAIAKQKHDALTAKFADAGKLQK